MNLVVEKRRRDKEAIFISPPVFPTQESSAVFDIAVEDDCTERVAGEHENCHGNRRMVSCDADEGHHEAAEHHGEEADERRRCARVPALA